MAGRAGGPEQQRIPDRPCCIDELRYSPDGSAEGRSVVVVVAADAAAGSVVDAVDVVVDAAGGGAGGDGGAAAGADEPTKPPVRNSTQKTNRNNFKFKPRENNKIQKS